MFTPVWTAKAKETYDEPKAKAEASLKARRRPKKTKATKDEALFKQVHKCIRHPIGNPKHPDLATHEFHTLTNPYDEKGKVFEA